MSKLLVLLSLFAFILPTQSFAQSTSTKTNTNTAAAEAATNAVIANVEDYVPRRRWSPWSLSYFNWATQNVADSNEGDGMLSTYNHFSLNYRFSGGAVAIRPVFFVSGAGKNYRGDIEDPSFEMGDVYLQYAKYNFARLPGDIGVYAAFRWYLPVSSLSKEQGTLSQLRSKFIFSKQLGFGWQSSWVFEPRYYIKNNRAYLGEWNIAKQNKYAEVRHYYEIAKLFDATWGLSGQVGSHHEWYYDVPAEALQNRIDDEVELGFYGLANLGSASFKLGVKNAIDVRAPNRYGRQSNNRLFKSEETEYSLMTYVNF